MHAGSYRPAPGQRQGAAARLLIGLAAMALLMAPAASADTLLRNDFTGPAGATAPAPWVSMSSEQCGALAPHTQGTVCDPARATLDGYGHLRLTVTPGGGAFLGTFGYGTGWPPKWATWMFAAPAKVTIRLKMPTLPGVWAGNWLQQVDRWAWLVDESDFSEQRSSAPDVRCYQHTHGISVTSYGILPGRPADWHTYSVRIDPTRRTVYRIDGRVCMTAPAMTGYFGLLLHAIAGAPGTWQTFYGPALPPGRSASVRVDYVRVTR